MSPRRRAGEDSPPHSPTTPAGGAAVYSHPRIYDILHTPGTADEVNAVELLARRWARVRGARGGRIGSWLEPACGTGRYLRAMARRAARRAQRVRLVGVDVNEAMLEYARVSVPAARFVRADMRRLSPRALGGAFDAAFTPQNSIRHMRTDTEMVRHLRAVLRCVRPGGVYIVGTALEPAEPFNESEDHYEARRGSLVVRDDVQYVPLPDRSGRTDGQEQVHSYVSVRRVGESTPVTEITSSYRLWCGSPASWARLVARSGFEQVGAFGFDGEDLGVEHRGYAMRVLRRASRAGTSRRAG